MKSDLIEPQHLKPIESMDRLFLLADKKLSVWWIHDGTHSGRLWPAAFFQNWNARHLRNYINNRYIMEVTKGE